MNEVIIPENIEIIGSESFSNAIVTRVSIPPSVTRIGEYAFFGCTYLDVVDIPENSQLQRIDYAFQLSKISQIYIPQCVESIGKSAFDKQLKLFEVADKSQLDLIINNNGIFKLKESIITAPNNTHK